MTHKQDRTGFPAFLKAQALALMCAVALFTGSVHAANVTVTVSSENKTLLPNANHTARSKHPAREVVLIDTGVEDWRTLARGVPADASVVRVGPGEDGITALADAVEGKTGIRAIHVISHGESGAIRLGGTRIDGRLLEKRSRALRTIRSALAPQADILLAACDTASGAIGRSFLDSLARATGADIAASTDATGSSTVGTNWDLEASTGEIETRLALSGEAMEKFQGRLAIDSQVTFGFSTYDGNLGNGDPFNQTIEADGSSDQMSFTDWRIDEFEDPDFGVNMNDGGPDSVFSDPAGDSFQFVSFTTEVFCGSPMTFDVVGYEDGSPVTGATQSFSIDGTAGTITRTVGFASVDEVRFENYSASDGSQCLKVDNIILDQAVTSNTQPSYTGLDATVAYDEVSGAPVVIDGDAGISDAELDGANDYAGSSLTIERTGGASGDDDFGFDTGAGTFSVSGGDLLTGGNVFASFTESGGTLTIDFNSSQAAATSSLVDDVLQGITYANPSDPDVVEYALTLTFNDGDAGGALQVSDSRPVVVDPDLAPISSATTLDFTAQESELAHGDPVDARIIQELLFHGFDFEDASENSLVTSSGLKLVNATSDKNTTPNRMESDATFLLDSIDIENFSTNTAQDVTVHGYLNGSLQASETFSFASEAAPQTFDMDALDAAFLGVDELRFTTSENDSVAIDNIVVDAGNQSPTIDLNTGEGGNDHTAAFSENDHQGDTLPLGGGVAVTGPVEVEDPDGDPETITVTLDNNQGDTGEQLYLDNGGLVGAVTGAGSGNSLTLVRHGASPAALVDTLTNVRYQNNDDTPDQTDRTVTVEVTDDLGATTSATSTVTVEAGNDAPSITAPGGTLQPDEDIAFDLSDANEIQIADVDAGGATVEVSLSANNGTLTLGSTTRLAFDSGSNGAGALTVSGTVDDLNNALATLEYQGNADYFGADTINATVNDRGHTGTDPGNTGDGSSESDSTTVSLDVQPVADAPTISAIPDQATDEDTTLSGIAFTVDDAETAAGSLTVSFSADTPALIADHTFGGSGANRTLEITPAPDRNGSTLITVEVDDGGLTATEDFLLTINAVNDLPTVSPAIGTLDATVTEDGAVPSASITVDDVESGGGGVTVTASSDNQTLVPDANLSVTDNGGGDRTLDMTLAPDENGTTTITVTLDDGTDTVDDSFQLTVNAENDPPAVSLDQNSDTIAENNGGNVTVAQISIDDDNEAGSTNNLSLTGADAGDFAINGSDLEFTGSADFESKNTYDVTVEVDDPGIGATPDDSASFTLNISDVDEPPAFSATGPFAVSESAGNGTAVGDVDAVDGDGGAADANLTYTIIGGNTDDGAFAIDAAMGAITVANATAVDFDTNPAFNLKIEADDGGLTTTETVTVNVSDTPPTAPVDADSAANTVPGNAANGDSVGVTASASDPDGGAVTYAMTDDAGGRFQINASTGIVTVADRALLSFDSGVSYTIKIEAHNADDSASAASSFTISMQEEEGPNDDSVLQDETIAPGQSISNALLIGDIRNEGVVLDVTLEKGATLTGGRACGMIDNGGLVRDVRLCAGAVIEGGAVGGVIEGDESNNPPRINSRIRAGSTLRNVIIGPDAEVSPDIVAGEGVRFASGTNIPSGLDLSGLFNEMNWDEEEKVTGVNLDRSIVDGQSSVLEELRSLPMFRQPGTGITQGSQDGEMRAMIGDSEARLFPVHVTRVDGPAGATVTDDGDVSTVTDSGQRVVSHPLIQDVPALHEGLAELGLSAGFDERAVLTVEPSDTTDGKLRYRARGALFSRSATRGTAPGLSVYTRTQPPANVAGASLVFENGNGEMRQQELVPAPADWFTLKESLESLSDAGNAAINERGVISLTIGGAEIHAMADLAVTGGGTEEGSGVTFNPVGDLNGDGTLDYTLVYPDGSLQDLYILPQ